MLEPLQILRRADYFLVGLFSFALFAYCGISGRPLTMHEARLPETAREMKNAGEWLLPHSGIRPWLERPPLPHWVMIGVMTVFRCDNQEWVVRLPSAVMGMLTALLTAWIAGRWFGRDVAVISGLVLATSFEFYRYAGAAEDDIYLAALVAGCMALFTAIEQSGEKNRTWLRAVLGNRGWKMWSFFLLLGLTNLAKGPLLGVAIVGSGAGCYLIWQGIIGHRFAGIWRYMWLWGWALTMGLTLAWPLWAYHKYPDVLANWKYDYLGRMSGTYSDINQPWWYYVPTLAMAMLPWTPACLIGLLLTGRRMFGGEDSAESRGWRMMWCWGLAPVLLFSIPKGKHHHYLVPFLVPWAIIGAVGVVEVGKFAMAKMDRRRRVVVLGSIFALLFGGYCAGESLFAARTDQTVDDTAFLHRVAHDVPADRRLFINAKLGNVGNLDFFRIQFYSPETAILLHNLSYLRDEKITDAEVYVISRARDEVKLSTLGNVLVVDQSVRSHEIPTADGRFTLFRLRFLPDLVRYPAPTVISNMQAMERDDTGPWCGPKM